MEHLGATIALIESLLIATAVIAFLLIKKNNRRLKEDPTINTVPGAVFDYAVIFALTIPLILVGAAHFDSLFGKIVCICATIAMIAMMFFETKHVLYAYKINSIAKKRLERRRRK